MIRLIATDLDGTLLEPDGKLPVGVFEVIRELNALGIRVAACSGRQYDNLRRLFCPVVDEMAYICENGAVSFVDGEVAGVISMSPDLAWEVIHEMEARGDMNLLISGRNVTYMKDTNRHFTDDIVYRLRNTSAIVSSWEDITEPMLKVACQRDGGVAEIAPPLLEKWGNRLTATVSGYDWFDFTVANKGMGMRSLMAHLERGDLFAEAFAFSGIEKMPVHVVAAEATEVLLLEADRMLGTCLRACPFHRKMIDNLVRLLARKNLMFNQKLEVTSRRSTREKLMAYLVQQANRAGSASFQIPLDRQALADYLEVDRSGLSAEISKLRKEGVLLAQKNRFQLLSHGEKEE